MKDEITLTKNDTQVLRWLEKHKSITISQCQNVFYYKNSMGHDLARKRLRRLFDAGLIRRYQKDKTKEAVYYLEKKLEKHDLKILDVATAFYKLGIGEISTNYYLTINNKRYSSDGLLFVNNRVPIIIEVDYTHKTTDDKIDDVLLYWEKQEYMCIFLIVDMSLDFIDGIRLSSGSFLIKLPWSFNTDLREFYSYVNDALFIIKHTDPMPVRKGKLYLSGSPK